MQSEEIKIRQLLHIHFYKGGGGLGTVYLSRWLF